MLGGGGYSEVHPPVLPGPDEIYRRRLVGAHGARSFTIVTALGAAHMILQSGDDESEKGRGLLLASCSCLRKKDETVATASGRRAQQTTWGMSC